MAMHNSMIILRFKDFLKKYPLIISIKRIIWKILFIYQVSNFIGRVYVFFVALISLITGTITGKNTVAFKSKSTFFDDGISTRHHVGFLHDENFVKAFNGAFEGVPRSIADPLHGIAWRAHICTWAATQGVALKGDFVECGVWYGFLSRTMCNYVDFANYSGTFYLVDTWGKMPGSHPADHYQEDIFSVVQERFSDTKNVCLVRGAVPEVLTQVKSDRIAYLGIDMNGAIPERAALEYFYDKIVPGGIIYFDDYGWEYPDLRETVDEFFADKPESLLHFPSGNSIVVKL